MVEFDHDDGAVDAVVVDAFGLGATDPGEIGVVEMFADFFHFDFGVTGVHVGDELLYEMEELLFLRGSEV